MQCSQNYKINNIISNSTSANQWSNHYLSHLQTLKWYYNFRWTHFHANWSHHSSYQVWIQSVTTYSYRIYRTDWRSNLLMISPLGQQHDSNQCLQESTHQGVVAARVWYSTISMKTLATFQTKQRLSLNQHLLPKMKQCIIFLKRQDISTWSGSCLKTQSATSKVKLIG